MDTTINAIFQALLHGGSDSVVAILVVLIGYLYLEKLKLNKNIEKKDEKIDKVLNDYYQGNITLSDALNSLKLVLIEIKSKL